jgi:two-component system LytT family response regulator
MKKYTAVIIDDEKFCVETLVYELKRNCPEVQIVATCLSPEEGIVAIQKHKPDVVFLDIEMPYMNGFEMLSKLQDITFHIIFTTAYDQFAIKAIKVNALDYLLKPIGKEEIVTAVNKIKEGNKQQYAHRLKSLMEQMLVDQNGVKKIGVATAEGIEMLRIDQIIYISADSNYSEFYLLDGKKILYSKTLKIVEQMLEKHPNFLRIHQSYIINLNYLELYRKGAGGSVKMINNQDLPVARAKKELLLERIEHN